MLDNEPDNNNSFTSAQNLADTTSASSAPRRRRAATRRAGPPIVPAEPTPDQTQPAMTAEAAPAQEPTAQEPTAREASAPTEPVPAEQVSADEQVRGDEHGAAEQTKPAKKSTRKRAAKATEGATRAPRKRASKKAAAAPTVGDDDSRGGSAAPVETAQTQPDEQIESDEQLPQAAEVADEPAADQAAVDQPAGQPANQAAAADEATSVEDTADEDRSAEDAGNAESDPDAEAALDEIRLALSAELPPAALTEDAAGATDGEQDQETTDAEDSDESENSDDDDSDDDDSDDESSAEGDDESGAPRRRRRRRGGRRRRRGGGGSDSDDSDRDGSQDRQGDTSSDGGAASGVQGGAATGGDEGSDSTPGNKQGGDRQAAAKGDDSQKNNAQAKDSQAKDAQAKDAQAKDAQNGDGDGEEGGDDSSQRRRRRRRRRRGEETAPAADDPAEVVVRVREPRSRKQAAQEVTGIEGSTRMEAKRQRRREGREAGRRRAPILSEAEFLARREAVVRKMVIRQRDDLSQIAVLEDDILVEHYVDRESAASLIGNVYLGRVQNVLPSMEAAFIDIGRGRNAVLYAGEVDWEGFGATGQQRKVENVLKSGQTVLVQVTKDPVGAKGARLTSHITLPGRYIVYAPGGHLSGISRKLPDNERKRLKSILNDLVPDSASVIVRTAAEGSSEDELTRDVNRLKAQWEDIERKVKQGSAPKLLYGEPDLTVRIVRDLFTEDFAELIIQGNGSQADAYGSVDAYVGHVAPHLHDRMRRWDAAADGDLFAKFRLDEQIAKALERKVFLPSGGSLIIDRTEAMTVIDVNTGKFTGSGGNLEATVTSNNLEAAEEIVRQLRLRDIGGIIVIDFIDMVLPSNRELLLRRLVECLGRDRTRHQVAEVTSLGLVQMTRKKIGTGLLEAFTAECEHCHGRGYEISDVPVEAQKQPDGGSRDHRGGGGGGGGRGRGRGNQSGSDGNGNGKPHHPVPAPPLQRPVPTPASEASADSTQADSTQADSTQADSTQAEPAAQQEQAVEPVARETAAPEPDHAESAQNESAQNESAQNESGQNESAGNETGQNAAGQDRSTSSESAPDGEHAPTEHEATPAG